ncbi:MOSC domain-containing protein [Pseudonocardia sp. TRM90224]|uniref:MOSC domain-containing protein n=1 Tax=Pseudonocardia sp. TRM90224 TaxID=2812678 RepID=UPI001E406BA8|nr:MOSC domain-containing protein [Pseudonocardia sp. TRM90224]
MTTFGALVSVNAGSAAPMAVQGETVVSGFDKRPLPDAGWVDVGGLAGDDHVADAHDLDRAVLLYQRHHYDSWSRELGRALAPGTFGEQLTVEGPGEDDVLIGDELRIGGALLQVTQPRIPCRKMAVRLDEPDMPVRYLRSGRLGFFCKVVEPGRVRAGDRIEVVRRAPDGLTLTELAAVLHHDEPDPDRLERALASSVLPELIRAKLALIAARDRSWTADRPLLVTSRTAQGADVVAFELSDPDGGRLPNFAAGQFLTLTLDVPGVERPVVRTYTIAGRSADGLGYRLAVKREPAGLASGHLHDGVAAGATVSARAPRGRFVVRAGARPVVLVSAGIGITPMLAMLAELATEETTRDVFFVHGARSSRELAFGQHVRELVATGSRLHSRLLFSRPQPHDRVGVDFDLVGRVTVDVLDEAVPGLDADFYVCGPVPFMTDVVAGLLAKDVSQEQVHYEFFGAGTSLFEQDGDDGAEVLDGDGRPIMVTFARSGLTVAWRENSFSLLALAERAGLRPEASCRAGVCNTCVARIDDGDVEYAIEPMDPVTPGKVAVCCARPRSSVMIDL